MRFSYIKFKATAIDKWNVKTTKLTASSLKENLEALTSSEDSSEDLDESSRQFEEFKTTLASKLTPEQATRVYNFIAVYHPKNRSTKQLEDALVRLHFLHFLFFCRSVLESILKLLYKLNNIEFAGLFLSTKLIIDNNGI